MEDSQIVEAIDSRQWSKAQSLIKLKQAKNPNSSYYVALSCYLLFKSGKSQQALDDSVALLNKYPTDTRAIDLLFQIFQSSGRPKEACLLYENLVKRYPNNCEAALLQWFENGITSGNASFVQKAAMNLSKVNKDSRKYKFWASFGCYLWSKAVNDEKQASLFQSLGRKLLDGLQPQSTQELFVFLQFPIDESSLSLIESFDDELDLDVQLIYMKNLEALEKWDTLSAFTTEMLFSKHFNDFDTWKWYIQSNFHLGTAFETVESKIAAYKFSRNSTLALIELASVYSHPKFGQYVKEYYEKFNTKSCCFNDLRNYSHQPILEHLSLSFELGNVTSQNLNTLINNQKLRFAFGQVDNGFFKLNWEIYNHFSPLLKSKHETDFFPANDLILINIITDLNNDSSEKSVLKSIVVLYYLVQNDPFDSKVNIWLVRLLSVFNFSSEMFRIFELLKIKMLQYESLGHIITNRISTLDPKKKNVDFLINVFRLYLTCDQDFNENIVKGFQEGIYNKLENFISFKDKISNSLFHYQVILDIVRSCRANNDKNYERYFSNLISANHESLFDGKIADNRDFKVGWKSLGFSKEFVESFKLDHEPPAVNETYLKLNYLKELFLMEFDYKKLANLTKLYNKHMTSEGLTPFEAWLFKVYGSLFKLKGKINDNELNSSLNFLTKNLKVTKVKTWLGTHDWELTSNILSLVELNKIIAKVIGDCPYNVASLKTVNEQLLSELKSNHYKTNQLGQLRAHKAEVRESGFALAIDGPFVDDLFDKLNDSMSNASYASIKY